MKHDPVEYECPICWQPVTETRYGHCIGSHQDTAGRTCPASGRTFDIATKTTSPDHPRRGRR